MGSRSKFTKSSKRKDKKGSEAPVFDRNPFDNKKVKPRSDTYSPGQLRNELISYCFQQLMINRLFYPEPLPIDKHYTHLSLSLIHI